MHCTAYGPIVKHSSPIGNGPVHGVHSSSVGERTDSLEPDVVETGLLGTFGNGDAVRFCCCCCCCSAGGGGGGAPGQPQVVGKERHSKVMHWPAWRPLWKHSVPIGTGSWWVVQVVAYLGDAVEVGVGMMAVVGPLQASSSGQGATVLGGGVLRGTSP